ncbi:hypothetical protein PCLA_03r0650 [Pseudomonas citronellolis]|nr:hypothetical protein PCLA_03r0650 [Pseudomonas citronellolis]
MSGPAALRGRPYRASAGYGWRQGVPLRCAGRTRAMLRGGPSPIVASDYQYPGDPPAARTAAFDPAPFSLDRGTRAHRHGARRARGPGHDGLARHKQ